LVRSGRRGRGRASRRRTANAGRAGCWARPRTRSRSPSSWLAGRRGLADALDEVMRCAPSTRRASTSPIRSSAVRISRAPRRLRRTGPPISACTAARCSRYATQSVLATSLRRAGVSILSALHPGTPRRPSRGTAPSTSDSAPTTARRMPRASCTRFRRPAPASSRRSCGQ